MIRLLLVDDDPVNRQILVEHLEEEGYDLVQAADGEEALAYLEREGHTVYAVLLDRMMPKMDGLTVLRQMQEDERFKGIPVIMQTAAGAPHEIRESVEAGSFFHLIKPYDRELLLAIVAASVRKASKYREVQDDVKQLSLSVKYMETATFHVRTLDEVHNLCILLANACPDPEKIVMGLNDIIINALEHGNLEISYEEKDHLQEVNEWEQEIERRSNLLKNEKKFVDVRFERFSEEIHILVSDQGKGFDWRKYDSLSLDLGLASHGRGIAMARALCFDRLEYQGSGNQVLCVISCPLAAIPTHDPNGNNVEPSTLVS